MSVDLMDGRTITVPLAWYPRLRRATKEQLAHWQECGGGYGIHWPDIDEDVSTEGLLRGARPLGHSFKRHKHNSKYDALTKLNNLRFFQTHINIYAYTLSILFGYTIFCKDRTPGSWSHSGTVHVVPHLQGLDPQRLRLRL